MNLEDWIDRVKRVRDRHFIDELQVSTQIRPLSIDKTEKKEFTIIFHYFSQFFFCAEYRIC